eukprot:4010853-Pyramimonas_sp.AAC.1
MDTSSTLRTPKGVGNSRDGRVLSAGARRTSASTSSASTAMNGVRKLPLMCRLWLCLSMLVGVMSGAAREVQPGGLSLPKAG